MGTKRKDPDRLRAIHIRLFEGDVLEVKRIAKERGLPYQIELRMLVRRALKGDRREVVVMKEQA